MTNGPTTRPSKTGAAGWALLFAALLSGCSSDEAERRAREARAEAAQQLQEAQAQLERQVQETREEIERRYHEWQPVLAKAAADVKCELDKVYKSNTEYELIIHTPEEDEARLREHETRLAKMDRVQVHNLTIGCEQCDDLSLGGIAYERHYRATWVMEGRVIGVSFYSKKEIDTVAFAELLQQLAPKVSEQITRHVTLRRGQGSP